MAGRVFPGSSEGEPTFTLTDEHFDVLVNDLEPRLRIKIDEYLTARFFELKKQFDLALKDEHGICTKDFQDNIQKICDGLPSLVDKTVARSMPSWEPSIFQDVTFPGGHARLRSFLHQMKSSLILHKRSFTDDSARINWVARHFRPDNSSSHLWWMSLIHANALAQHESHPYKSAGLAFVIPELSSVDSFLTSLVEEFKDPFSAESAINALCDCHMAKNSSVPDFNSRFTVLAGEAEVTEASKMSYYKDSLLDHLRAAAVIRPDWSAATTLRMQQNILVQVERGISDARNSRSRLPPTGAPSVAANSSTLPAQSVVITRDPNAMEVDATSTAPFPNQLFRELCTERKICTSCLGVYDLTHKGAMTNQKVLPAVLNVLTQPLSSKISLSC